jgi:hypothetical protein
VQPDNAIIGDESGIELPQAPENVVDLTEEKNIAKYSQTKEFKRLKGYMEGRIEFFQKFLPDGTALNSLDPSIDLGQQWKLANLVIAEFQAVIDEYDRIKQVVHDAGTDKPV